MPDKPKTVTPDVPRQPTLTDMAERNRLLSAELAKHTLARNYLWTVASGNGSLPILELRPFLMTETESSGATLDTSELPQEILETVLAMMIEHEERYAFNVWTQLLDNATEACTLIKRVKAEREKAMQQQQAMPMMKEAMRQEPMPPEDDPTTIPMEVPRGWPGRPDQR